MVHVRRRCKLITWSPGFGRAEDQFSVSDRHFVRNFSRHRHRHRHTLHCGRAVRLENENENEKIYGLPQPISRLTAKDLLTFMLERNQNSNSTCLANAHSSAHRTPSRVSFGPNSSSTKRDDFGPSMAVQIADTKPAATRTSSVQSQRNTLSLYEVATQVAIEKQIAQEILGDERKNWATTTGLKTGAKLLNAFSRKLSTASLHFRQQPYNGDGDGDGDRNRDADRDGVGNELEEELDDEEECCSCIDSVQSQLEELSHEVNSTIEFLGKAYQILMRTSAATICLAVAIVVPVLMTYFGLKYLEECPIEPHIPIYLLVGGGFGIVNLLYLIWRHSVKRYSENNDVLRPESATANEIQIAKSSKILDVVNFVFLLAWFACGNYWVFSVYNHVRMESSYYRRTWCHRNVYWFTLAQVAAGNCFIILLTFFLLALILFYRTHRYRAGQYL